MISLGTPEDDQLSLSDKSSIERLLQDQVDAWNRGDLPGFLAGYSRSKDTTFTADGVTRRGFDATQRRFYETYGKPAPPDQDGRAPTANLGSLELLLPREVVLLSRDSAWVLGSARLAPPEPGAAASVSTFTLVLRRTAGVGTRWAGWRIVHDHTSKHPPEQAGLGPVGRPVHAE